MGHELPGPNQKLSTIDNLDVDKKGSNTDLIEALKKEDEVKSEGENEEKIDKEAEVETIEQKVDKQIGKGSELNKDLTGTFAEFTSDGKIITSDDPRHSSNITKKKSFKG